MILDGPEARLDDGDHDVDAPRRPAADPSIHVQDDEILLPEEDVGAVLGMTDWKVAGEITDSGLLLGDMELK